MNSVERGDLLEIKQAFERVDKDADGRIIAEEFRQLLQVLDPDLSHDECLLAFELTDEDGDGPISFQEFVDWWTAE